MSDKPIVKINGGFPPIKDTKPVKKEKEKSFSKERGFASSNLKTVNISNILKAKKEDIIKKDKVDLEVVDSL
jgi:hypothetical protein